MSTSPVGWQVQTPTIDGLVKEGINLDRHYAYRICGPARASLLSGRLATHVLVKNVAVTARNTEDPVSGYAGIPRNMTGWRRWRTARKYGKR